MSVKKHGFWLGLILLVFVFVEGGFAQSEPNEVQPLWQLSLTAVAGSANTIFYGDTVAYYFQDEQLQIIDIQTGEALWQVDYPLITVRDYTLLPASGEGLIFVPRANTLNALNERTGEQVWSYKTDEPVAMKIQETNNRTGVFYDEGSVFLQAETKLIRFGITSGEVLWQQVKGERVVTEVQILNENYVLISTEALLDMNKSHRASQVNPHQDIRRLNTGEFLWFIDNDFNDRVDTVLNSGADFIDISVWYTAAGPTSLQRYDLETGEKIASCLLNTDEFIRGQMLFRIRDAVNSDTLTVKDGWVYTKPRGERSSSQLNISRIPFCTQDEQFATPPAEPVSNNVDKYLLSTLLYYDIRPFTVQSGPQNGFFLFQNEGQLYKVPVPQESFTYLYHNKTDDSVYIEPKFADIDPPPYVLIPGIESKVANVELMDGFVVALLDDGTLQVINFDSSETVLKAATGIAATDISTSFHKADNVLIVESLNNQNSELVLQAYSLSQK